MKYPTFADMGDDYPIHLETRFERILARIEELWDAPELHDYLSDLLIDKRGGREGFPHDVVVDIMHVRDFRELSTLRQAESRTDAIAMLNARGHILSQANYLQAVRRGDQEVVDLFIRANFNVHMLDENGHPPLMIALKQGYTVVAQILLKAGADVNMRDPLGLTPLLVACGKQAHGYRAIAETLIQKGAHINIRDPLGNSPLLLALSGGTVEVAELLIQRGADINACTREGHTPLSLAINRGHHGIVSLLQDLLSGKPLPEPAG